MNDLDNPLISSIITLAKEVLFTTQCDNNEVVERIHDLYGVNILTVNLVDDADVVYELINKLRKANKVINKLKSIDKIQTKQSVVQASDLFDSEFKQGDKLSHTNKPEWGIGYVVSSAPHFHDGNWHQKLVVNFTNAGYKTIISLPNLLVKK